MKDIRENKKLYILNHLHKNMDDYLDKFLEIIIHSNQISAAELIAKDYLSDIIYPENCHPSKKYRERYSFWHENSREKVLEEDKSLSSMSGIFEMTSHPRGYCLLINNYVTYGTFKEFHNLRKIFYQLHFEVLLRMNMKAKEITELLRKLAEEPEIKKPQAFIFMILTHGNNERKISGFDGQQIHIDDIINQFNNKNCPVLRERPRIFIFNCCRGGEHVDLNHLILTCRNRIKNRK